MEYVRWLSQPTLRNPVVVAAFTGWNDAGDAASGAIRHLVETWGASPLAEIDPEEFTDFATIRPHVRLSAELTRSIVWPTVGLWYASVPGADVILALGPEPAMRWRCFAEQLVGVASEFKASMVVALGALLADVPHNRPVQLIGTASDQDMIDRFDLQRSRYEGPTGIVGVIQDACNQADLLTASLWAAVPAYASQIGSPKASLALLERLGAMIGTPMPVGRFAADISDYEARVDAAVAGDDDLAGYVRRLEGLADSGIVGFDGDIDDDEDDDDDDSVGGELAVDLAVDVDGHALMDEVERFLRDQGE
jgi:proteasome assembly chaperone (PAC2) family protein